MEAFHRPRCTFKAIFLSCYDVLVHHNKGSLAMGGFAGLAPRQSFAGAGLLVYDGGSIEFG